MNSLWVSLFLVFLPLICEVEGTLHIPALEDAEEDPFEGGDTKSESEEYSEERSEVPQSIGGVEVTQNMQILNSQRPMIHKIELEISTGKEIERNLTSLRELLLVEIEKCRTRRERIEIQRRLNRIDVIIQQVHTRTEDTEMKFRTFLRRVSLGEIRTEGESQTLLQAIWSGYHKSLRNIVGHAAGLLRSVVRGVTGALANFGMGVLDFYRLKFQPLELAVDALTNRGSFKKPIRGLIIPR